MARTVNIDEYSLAPMIIEMRSGTQPIGTGTAFAFEHKPNLFLITNWHNVTGKNPRNGKHLSPTAAEPQSIDLYAPVDGKLGLWSAQSIPLSDGQGRPIWFEHPSHRREIDVVAIPVTLRQGLTTYPINKMGASCDMTVRIGHDLYILGFPFSLSLAVGFPVWKRASIATEPEIDVENLPKFMVDTASRPGMSGSPVIRRCDGQYQAEDQSVRMIIGTASRFVGIYSGRIGAEDELKAQLGIVW